MNTSATALPDHRWRLEIPVVVFGIAIAGFFLYLFTFAIDLHQTNDFYREAWPPYRELIHGHVVSFLRDAPAYFGSLILRAPFALAAGLLGGGQRAVYFATALPCLIAPAVLAGWLAGSPQVLGGGVGRRGIRPLDLSLLTPPVAIAVIGGHPEDVLGGVLCIAAVLLSVNGSGTAAGLLIGLAMINKSWALIVLPLVLAMMPPQQRLRGGVAAVLVAGVVMVPVLALRSGAAGAGASLGDQSGSIFLVPQLLWWFGRTSWIAQQAHVLLVVVCWICTGIWWWMRSRDTRDPVTPKVALIVLALLFFLRCALDPWDNLYYYAPFMLAVMTYETTGFPRLSWLYAILLPIVVPPHGLLHGLGANLQAAAYAAFALPTIAWLAWRSMSPRTPAAERHRQLKRPKVKELDPV